KCYEERGEERDLFRAIGIYNGLLEHNSAPLRPLQRHVAFFRIVALRKREEFALAADEADQWLRKYNTPESLRDRVCIGVQFQLAKNLIAQLPGVKEEALRNAATKKIVDTLGHVVRYSSPYKTEAVDLLKNFKPNS